ncbi:helix-turn-helix domain-containing protein [Heyndrickxia oleronia]|jgi:transcriptional regulator with XRE-family HTH domain|uniref:helix-turn-helix domain-containing protein n=1 Tax=Heyndrickxia oleronia TaxID=38875 RepID=UPI00242BB123|nr:helix-turn-helix transcriptional regulator [Heyndrickxia oleronia]MCI1590251.1 helix-turn-helix domain-containing protein [Heyndrickxia oleronia]MCI1614033.1 helix-turn-helix domain-containing protein [Heyndrickxia oleronia]MCI1744315.1 helix-turn-helix domain-containing protein [Heyndrickxia oleronia]MCI1761895.1 helix-turn-helix domain-containing protein [Heyndrickxia oleronia]
MNYKKLGSRIREERLKLGLTQEILSEEVNISVSYMGQIERGERSLSLDTLVKLAQRLGVTIDYLLQDSLKTNRENSINQFANLIDNRSEKQIQMALDMIKVLFSHLENND